MKADIQKLKTLAEASLGEWYESGELRYEDRKSGELHGLHHDDERFIAAANPAAVLELINELKVALLQLEVQRELAAKRYTERDQLKAENERLQRFETAYKEFSDKTEWVRPNAAAHELGMHVADILRKRCDDLTSHNQAQAEEIVRLRKDRDRLAADYAALAEDPGSAL